MKIVANLNYLEALVPQVVSLLQSFASNKQDAMFEDFALADVHNALVMYKALANVENRESIKHILKTPIHSTGIKGAVTKSLHKLGIKGVAAEFHEVLNDFHRSFLATEELRPQMLPKGFLIVKFSTDHNEEMLEKDEFRKVERKRQIINEVRRGETGSIKF